MRNVYLEHILSASRINQTIKPTFLLFCFCCCILLCHNKNKNQIKNLVLSWSELNACKPCFVLRERLDYQNYKIIKRALRSRRPTHDCCIEKQTPHAYTQENQKILCMSCFAPLNSFVICNASVFMLFNLFVYVDVSCLFLGFFLYCAFGNS